MCPSLFSFPLEEEDCCAQTQSLGESTGDDSSGFRMGIYYGSGSSDGAARGFWRTEWDTWNLTCRCGISDSYVSWPFRPVSRLARLKRCNREPPARLTINIEGYRRGITVQLINQRIIDWLKESRGSVSLLGVRMHVHLTLRCRFS